MVRADEWRLGLLWARETKDVSKQDNFCLDECQYYEKKDYYWCHTADGWDYCSPELDVTYRDKPCRSDHFCDTHGENYNWCWTSESDYDYCGPIVHPDHH
ncbi:hypothetical protein ABG768_020307 [Culter alburnus]|uniref:Uncharacterized protein n=1 Tax=Culter alburnus TaxID=194366 RepID=A0AAW2B0N0_CULAL